MPGGRGGLRECGGQRRPPDVSWLIVTTFRLLPSCLTTRYPRGSPPHPADMRRRPARAAGPDPVGSSGGPAGTRMVRVGLAEKSGARPVTVLACDDAQVSAESTGCVPEQPARRRIRRWWAWAPLVGLTVAVLVGALLRLAGRVGAADLIWAAVTVAALLPAALVDAALAVAPALRRGRDRRPGPGRGSRGRRVPGRCGDRGDGGDRTVVGGVRAAPGHPGPAGTAGTRSAYRASPGAGRGYRGGAAGPGGGAGPVACRPR